MKRKKKAVKKKAKKTKKNVKKTKVVKKRVRKAKKVVKKKAKKKVTAKKKVVRKTKKKAKKVVRKTKKKAVKKTAKRKAVRKVKKKARKVVRKVKKHKKVTKKTKKKTVKKKAAKKSKKKNVVKKSKKSSQKPKKKVVKPQPTPAEKPKPKYPVVPLADADRVKMLSSVLKELVRRKIISDWRINLIHKRSAELYVGTAFAIEDTLTAIREDVTVTLHKRFDDMIGEVQLPILTEDREQAKQQLIEASSACEHAKKQAYKLPQPQEGLLFMDGYDRDMMESFLEGKGLTVAHGLYDRCTAILKELSVKTNCMEILTSGLAHRVVNSEGVDVSWHKTVVHLKTVLSYEEEGNEQEYQWNTTVVSPDQLNLRATFEQQEEIVKDAVRATPCDEFEGDVLLASGGVLDFFSPAEQHSPLILHTFAKLKQMQIARLHAGESLGEFTGEPFSLSSNPHLPLGLLTAPVDEEGTPLKPVDLIKTGLVMNHIAPPRYAQYLNLPVTGQMANVYVGAGATREEHLRGHNYVEIVSFSWFNPDPYSGDFAAEIRLGYKWERGKKMPFKGGFFSGNVFTNLLNTRFSKEVMQSGRYYGPRAMLFKDARVSKPK
ncbi:MAG: metallopeptidase TldD-related protein [Candidatus Woesearchaeota archaeon]|nr:metallopeptidase TldD-related protein [Candidatus Woesearchaeota archaeon]